MYSLWARRRRSIFLSFVLLVVVGSIAAVTYRILDAPETCTDGIANQDETGVDCGGVCTRVCEVETTPLRLQWVRAFRVAPGWWSALAYIENANVDMRATQLPYRIRLYDTANFIIAETEGAVDITDEVLVPVYWGRIFLPEDRVVARATFEWLATPEWHRIDTLAPRLTTKEQRYTTRNGLPEVRAVLTNEEYVSVEDVTVTAIVYDSAQNATAVSHTRIPRMEARESRTISFVWQEPFSDAVSRIELISRASFVE
jgi:hypothetical protein